MKTFAVQAVMVLLAVLTLGGCDIFEIDNYDAPNATISGRVVYNGESIGVRNGAVQLELWQPGFGALSETQKVPVHVAHDGTFQALVFDGSYEINLLAGNGPWVTNTTRHKVELKGAATVDVPVTPYYTIQNVAFTRGAPTEASPGGTLTATFKVGQIDTSRQLEYVGLYIGMTTFVDRTNSLVVANNVRERTRSAIQPQLDTNGDISITIPLPADIHRMPGPERREYVFVRVGVKTVGVAEMLFTQVQKVNI